MVLKNTAKKLLSWMLDICVFRSIGQHQKRIAYLDSQQFIYENSSLKTKLFPNIEEFRSYCLMEAPEEGLVFEFGVFKGKSLNQFARLMQKRGDKRQIYGFDSFVGFSEDWTGVEENYPKDHFSLGGKLPSVEPNVSLINGFVEETLEPFMKTKPSEKVGFIHIDTDTYSPAKTILSLLKPAMKSGSVVLFDELCGYPNWRSHEYRALKEVFNDDEYEFIGFSQKNAGSPLIKAAIKIL